MANITGERTVEIDAPIERCFEIAADIANATDWQGSLRDVDVIERDGDRRALLVETESDAKVKTVKALLRFSYEEPTAIRWVQEKGDTKSLHGSWTFEDLGERAHPRDLRPRRRSRTDARDAPARPGRGQGARLPARQRGRRAQGAGRALSLMVWVFVARSPAASRMRTLSTTLTRRPQPSADRTARRVLAGRGTSSFTLRALGTKRLRIARSRCTAPAAAWTASPMVRPKRCVRLTVRAAVGVLTSSAGAAPHSQ